MRWLPDDVIRLAERVLEPVPFHFAWRWRWALFLEALRRDVEEDDESREPPADFGC